MAKIPWFRLYTEIMDDPKLANWTGDQFRILIYLFCLARESEEPGLIKMTAAEIAWRIRQPMALVEEVLYLGTSGERPILIKEGQWYRVVKWHDRQYDYPSDHPAEVAKRVRKHREIKRECNDNVTRGKRECNARDTDTDTDPDPDTDTDTDQRSTNVNLDQPSSLDLSEGGPGETLSKDGDDDGYLFSLFEKEMGRLLSPLEAEQIEKWGKESGPDLTKEALRRAVLQNRLGWKYIDRILLNWKKAGYRSLREVQERDPFFSDMAEGRAGPSGPGPPAGEKQKRRGRYLNGRTPANRSVDEMPEWERKFYGFDKPEAPDDS